MLLETVNLIGFGKKTQGKVRDIYIKDNKRILVTTDRQSAFDRNLGLIPHKGQVLNLLSKFWFDNTRDIVSNHFISLPHPNIMIVKNCQPIPIEMVVRGYISGVTSTSIWYSYEKGERVVYGIKLPDGLRKNQKLLSPIITPTTHGGGKGGHDERLTEQEILKRKLVSPALYKQMKETALKLFQRGTEICLKAGLILVDTKYEFGLYNGKLMLIDEIHTPDSSRFWIKETYVKRFSAGVEPENFDKEFLRLWFVKRGYRGDGVPPRMPQSFISKVSQRYIKVYEKITNSKYLPDNNPVMIKPKYALISVYDKTGIIEFANNLLALGYSIISTGGTAKLLTDDGIEVIPVDKITKNPESFDGRMKTISFQVEGGILYDRDNKNHQKQAKDLEIKPIDIVVCNFYPFEKKKTIENIDVGGPTMVRAAAKNYKYVTVVVDPNDYKRVINSLNDIKMRKELAGKAFRLLSYYDSLVARFLTNEKFPEKITIPGLKIQNLRYGENPHQLASFYSYPNSPSTLAFLKKQWGRDLSLVNATDINAGIESVRLFKDPCAVVIKHNTPCGIALGKTISEALKRAIEADRESAFGGIIVANKPIDLKTARVVNSFIDIFAAPAIAVNALKFLQKLRKSMGIYTFKKMPVKENREFNIKWVDNGFVLQTADNQIEESFKSWKIVTKIKPSAKQTSQMKIGWKFVSRIKSNTVIVVDKNIPMTRGIGSGQTSRIKSTKIALADAGKFAKGAILVSDSFFPFDDSIILAHEYGISAVVQQGGSINDQKVIDTANKLGISMIFTGRRAFWH